MNYLFHILTMISIYAVLGLSLNLVLGFGGMLSLCHAAFYGIGAYTFSLLMMDAGFSFLAALPIAVLASGLAALLIGAVTLRLRGDFFVLSTLGFQTIIFVVLYNWVDFTRGPYGIPGIPRPEILGFSFNAPWAMFLLAAAVALLAWWICLRLSQWPFGRTLQAVRDDALAAQSLGKNPLAFTLTAFALGGALAALAGGLFAAYASYIDPTSFMLEESVFILCVVVIGGAGNLQGPVIGAIILVLLPELLRFVGLPDSIAANLRQIIYGLLLVLMMRFRPQGIAGRYAFD
jgi:branched-chain amino acid transport system permease protein